MSAFHMTSDEFRRHGKELIDWIADYYDNIESYPVRSSLAPGEVRAALPDSAPQRSEPFEEWMNDVDRLIMPGITHWQSPDFYAFFPCNASGPAILGDLLSSGLNVQGMMWSTSPACTEVETHVLDWIVDMLELPQRFKSSSTGGGAAQDETASAAQRTCASRSASRRGSSKCTWASIRCMVR